LKNKSRKNKFEKINNKKPRCVGQIMEIKKNLSQTFKTYYIKHYTKVNNLGQTTRRHKECQQPWHKFFLKRKQKKQEKK
jgi:hypothetical protein